MARRRCGGVLSMDGPWAVWRRWGGFVTVRRALLLAVSTAVRVVRAPWRTLVPPPFLCPPFACASPARTRARSPRIAASSSNLSFVSLCHFLSRLSFFFSCPCRYSARWHGPPARPAVFPMPASLFRSYPIDVHPWVSGSPASYFSCYCCFSFFLVVVAVSPRRKKARCLSAPGSRFCPPLCPRARQPPFGSRCAAEPRSIFPISCLLTPCFHIPRYGCPVLDLLDPGSAGTSTSPSMSGRSGHAVVTPVQHPRQTNLTIKSD